MRACGTGAPSDPACLVAHDFLELAWAGTINRQIRDSPSPIKIDSIRMVKDVVLASDAVAVAPMAFIAKEVAMGKLVPVPVRVA